MASPIDISVSADVKALTRALTNFAYKQVPFATATALTILAKSVQEEEARNIATTFNKPKPFTKNSVGVQAARKDRLVATVYVKPIAARYLAPYEEGGLHMLPGRVLLNPKNIRLNNYGQLPRDMLAKLKARSDIFIGPVKGKSGTINGVWQRVPAVAGQAAKRGRAAKAGQAAHLKLLIRFGSAIPVNKRLNYRSRAQAIISRGLRTAFTEAMGNAIASAR